MNSTTVTVLGGDLRQCYLADYMYAMGHEITCYGTMPFSYKNGRFFHMARCLKESVSDAGLILCPLPVSRDGQYLSVSKEAEAEISLGVLLSFLKPGQILAGGSLSKELLHSLSEKQVTAIDYMEDSALTLANAALTAEGLLSVLISETPFSLTGKRALILGFGRCGQEIGKRLKRLDMKAAAYDRDKACLLAACMMGIAQLLPGELPEKALDYDIVINTIPQKLLTVQQLKLLPKDCVLFDIAPSPFGFDPAAVKDQRLKLIRCPGIPGNYMPETAGELIGKTILERML